jgi:hypothetical protein
VPAYTIDHIFGVNDQVAARQIVEASHTGDFEDIPPTGQPVRVTGITLARITSTRSSSSTPTPTPSGCSGSWVPSLPPPSFRRTCRFDPATVGSWRPPKRVTHSDRTARRDDGGLWDASLSRCSG